jgi:hypothetical protein
MWRGSADSVVDLHPSGFDFSQALAVSDAFQVGRGASGYNPENGEFRYHALVWSGTADSALDLNPSGFDYSEAIGVAGSYQVGEGSGSATGNQMHALLWNGTSASEIDLNPPGFIESGAFSISGTTQVGYASGPMTGNHHHAIVWSGTAASAVDLHSSLNGLGTTFIDSTAARIADNGSIVGYAYDIDRGGYVAVLWTPVPELTSRALLASGLFIASLFGRQRRVTLLACPAVLLLSPL